VYIPYSPTVGEVDFTDLYEALKSRVFSVARRRLAHHRAEEVTCSTFETVWAKRAECPLDGNERVAWVFGILRYKILQELERPIRKPHDHRFTADFHVEPGQGDFAEAVADSMLAKWVFCRLTAIEQELLTIAHASGMSREECAEYFALSVGAFSTRVSRLRTRIKQLYAEAEENAAPTGRDL
jgi:RNA polymerase sigma factor (sigma-70 family)